MLSPNMSRAPSSWGGRRSSPPLIVFALLLWSGVVAWELLVVNGYRLEALGSQVRFLAAHAALDFLLLVPLFAAILFLAVRLTKRFAPGRNRIPAATLPASPQQARDGRPRDLPAHPAGFLALPRALALNPGSLPVSIASAQSGSAERHASRTNCGAEPQESPVYTDLKKEPLFHMLP